MADDATIKIQGARQHNLKNLNLEIPRNRLVVITGVSGSGKSSLAFDTLYAEGQRRYVESLSAYARQFLDRLEKPDVDFITGLTPAIAIEQRSSQPNPRSTIATATEIYDYLRILYAALGQPHDPGTGAPLVRNTIPGVVEILTAFPERSRLILLAPVTLEKGGDLPGALARYQARGFLRVRLDGVMREIEEVAGDTRAERVEIVVDRLVVREDIRSRLADSLELARTLSPDHLTVLVQAPGEEDYEAFDFTFQYTNPETGYRLPALTPKHFSFNSHLGACPVCHGLGTLLVPDEELILPDPAKSISQGAVKTWWSGSSKRKGVHLRVIHDLAKRHKVDPEAPAATWSEAFRKALLHGGDGFEGLLHQAERLHRTSDSEMTKRQVRRFLSPQACHGCGGRRLREEMLSVTLPHESAPLSIEQFTALSIRNALAWVEGIALTESQQTYAREVVGEIRKRLRFLDTVGLGYLTLNRESGTLSGGESQRIRLATQLGAGLAGVLYVLDEPSIGLHQSDNEKLIGTLRDLRDAGNTVVVVEHDEDTIRAADHLIDLGPGAGEQGGELLAQGTPAEVLASERSLTAQYLSGQRSMEARPVDPVGREEQWLAVSGASEHNLRGIDVSFPLGRITCVTGVSGSGKSTLVDDIVRKALFRHFYQSKEKPGRHQGISGLEHIDKAIVVDQSPIGRSPRSNPATYIGVFTPIREWFARLPLARTRGYDSGRFSFNVAGGRCEACQGDGVVKIDMHFLSDVYVVCESCQGQRYNRETLDVTYRGKTIAEVLSMTVTEALAFFQKIPAIAQKLKSLEEVGLGYVALGQSATTLSGGEAQRVKLAAELGKTSTGRTLYLLDEPTTGLHFADIETLLRVFYRLRDQGNTLIVIEHNLDVIRCADWVIDMGPGGGDEGGRVLATGSPRDIARSKKSLTGKYLRRFL